MSSIWSEIQLPQFPILDQDVSTDVLIIGGGMAGLLCAHELQNAGVDYVLLESNTICSGITKNTTAKITAQHGLIYQKLQQRFGAEKTAQYYRANEAALRRFRSMCQGIDCDFETRDNYVYSRDNETILRQELKALQQAGAPAEFVTDLPLPFETAGAVKLPDQAQFQPMKFAAAIASGLHIFEQSAVQELQGLTAITKTGKVRANQVIMTTHFPMINKHGAYFLKLYQSRSYVLALDGAAQMGGMYLDAEKDGLSFRNFGQYLLLGGGGHRTGKQGGGWKELRAFADKYYPFAKERWVWATQDCMSLDGVPYIGQYSGNTPGFYVATGFNKWGMTSSMVAATLLCDLVQGRKNEYTSLFSPSRTILRAQLAVNGFEAVKNLLTPTTKRCPHLGCALKWNKQEQTWDCPCHGSRFAADGTLLDNPATGDVRLR